MVKGFMELNLASPGKMGMHKGWFSYVVFHRISSEFKVYDQLGSFPIYENQPKCMKTACPN